MQIEMVLSTLAVCRTVYCTEYMALREVDGSAAPVDALCFDLRVL